MAYRWLKSVVNFHVKHRTRLLSQNYTPRLLSRDSYSTSKSYPPDMDQDHGFSDDGQSIKLGLGQVRLVRVLNYYRFYLLVTGNNIPTY